MRSCTFCTLVTAAICSAASAQQFTLVDHNSTAHFDTAPLAPGSRVGMDSWVVDGVNHMYSQWFWFRTDTMNHEARLNSLPLMSGATSDTNFDGDHETLFLRFGSANNFTIETRFVLNGGAPGSGVSDIAEQIEITNHNSSAPITFSFFQYCDYDLHSDILDDWVGVVTPNTVRQLDFLHNAQISETVFTPTFNLAEVNTYANTLSKLDDASLDNLNGVTGPLTGRADYTWALQWNFTLLPGQTYLISKDKLLIPTPGSLALFGLGALAATRRRRR
ncbi:MAG: hypothetical protein KF864_13300 [Phycisphaeraceae bacterium]|nr:hypothetical protein [Phycisphaeraceae bacterium]